MKTIFAVTKFELGSSFKVGGIEHNTVGIVIYSDENINKCLRIKEKLRAKSWHTGNALYFVHKYIDGQKVWSDNNA